MIGQEIEQLSAFTTDENKPWFGRFRLWFNQVSPWIQERAFVKVRPDALAAVGNVVRELGTRHKWPIQLLIQGKHGEAWSFRLGSAEDGFICFEMITDICYIDLRNFNLAVRRLAPHLEDAHFFVFSSGDGRDRWLDEYQLANGTVSAQRWASQPDMLSSRLATYEQLLIERSSDEQFRRFVAFCYVEEARDLTDDEEAQSEAEKDDIRKKALAALTRALELDPGNQEARRLAELLTK